MKRGHSARKTVGIVVRAVTPTPYGQEPPGARDRHPECVCLPSKRIITGRIDGWPKCGRCGNLVYAMGRAAVARPAPRVPLTQVDHGQEAAAALEVSARHDPESLDAPRLEAQGAGDGPEGRLLDVLRDLQEAGSELGLHSLSAPCELRKDEAPQDLPDVRQPGDPHVGRPGVAPELREPSRDSH